MREICVVDDDPSVRRAVQRLLGDGRYDVRTFPSAEDFLASAALATAACLVLDVHLTGMSGFDLYDALDAAGSRVPVVFITAFDDAATRERVRRTGTAHYLRKPFDGALLIAAIEALTKGA